MMTTMKEVSEGLGGAVQAVAPSIVRVEGRRWMPASGLAWSEDGVVLTANHVVERDDEIKVGLPGAAETLPAALIGRDPATDLAVLRLPAGSLPAVKMAVDLPGVGELVLALGRPGKDVQASLGVVHASGGEWQTPAGARVEAYLQPDLVMYPGFSGGPLVDAAGQVIGLNTSGLLRNTAVTLLAPVLSRVAGELLAHGHMRRGYLGVGSQPVRLPEALAQRFSGEWSALQGQETGLLISSVQPGSPAEKAGLMLGDTLVALDGQPMRQMDDLLVYLNGDVVGHAAQATVVRGGALQNFSLVIGEK